MRRRRSCSETDPDLEIYEREWRRVEASEKLPFDPTLPADEHIALQSLWLVDVFLPSRASALLTGLEHLGLRDGSSEGGLSTEIAAARGSAYTASISPIGPFVPSGAAILTQVVREDLPGGVEAAWGWVYQITPAVTVIVWQFTLNDEESHKLEEVFRVHHQGTARRLGPDRITYTSKADVAQRAARGHRAAIRRRCTAWHRAISTTPGRRRPSCRAST